MNEKEKDSEEKTEKKPVAKELKLVEVKPLKDHIIKQNAFFYVLKKGEPISVAEHFLKALKTEKVIK